MILPPNKNKPFFYNGKPPDMMHKCTLCGFLLLVFFPSNQTNFKGVKIACVCGKIYTFINQIELTDCKDIKDVAKNTTTS